MCDRWVVEIVNGKEVPIRGSEASKRCNKFMDVYVEFLLLNLLDLLLKLLRK